MSASQQRRVGYSSLVVLALAFVAAVVASNTLLKGFRIDLTENRLYTLSTGTRNVLRGIEEPVNLYFFFSDRETRNVPFLRRYAERVRETLEEFEAAAGGGIVLHVIDPLPFSEEEDRAAQLGIEAVSVGTLGENIYFGLAGTNSVGDEAVVPFFQPDKEAFLEYDLARLVYSLATHDRTVVGLLSGVPMTGGFDPQTQQLTDAWVMTQQVRQLFEVRTLPASLDHIDEDVNVLWVVQPATLDEAALYALDQFVMRGGRALVFVDPLVEITAGGGPMGFNMSDGDAAALGPLFDAWGVRFSGDQVVVDNVHALSVNTGSGRSMRHLGLLGLDGDALDQDDVVTAGLPSVYLGTSGYFWLADETGGATLTPLLLSSPEAGLMPADRFGFLPEPDALLNEFRPTGERYALAARLQGRLASAFPDGPPDGAGEGVGHVAAIENGNVILVGDIDMLSDRMWVQRQSFLGQPLVTAFASNGDFVVNALDNLSGSADLISLRSRATFLRPFTTVEALRRDAEARFRQTEQRLQAELAETERRLAELQAARDDRGSIMMSPEQQQEVSRFLDQQLRIRQELRAVRRDLDRNIEQLGTVLKVINIGLVPVLLTVVALLVVGIRRSRRRQAGP